MVAAKRKRRKRRMPEPIPDSPESVARAILGTPPKARDEWRFTQEDAEESA